MTEYEDELKTFAWSGGVAGAALWGLNQFGIYPMEDVFVELGALWLLEPVAVLFVVGAVMMVVYRFGLHE